MRKLFIKSILWGAMGCVSAANVLAASNYASGSLSWADGSGEVNYKAPLSTVSEKMDAGDDAVSVSTPDAFENYSTLTKDNLFVSAQSALVVDAASDEVLFSKAQDYVRPIASITKVMTAMVTIDSHLDMHEVITLMPEDFIGAKKAGSKLQVGDQLNRAELLLIALMKSENPAAAALARTHPQGKEGFIRLMNAKAAQIGMSTAYFRDPTGLDNANVSSASDLVKMLKAANQYGVIRTFSSTPAYNFNLGNRILPARNTNAVVREGGWDIGLSKTGYINEAGRCVVMQAKVNNRPAYIVLMGARSSQGRTGDAKRILHWLQQFF